ncbi:hypothetical protein MBLNU457_1348t1 [Dothideomycetes sp. NU457]
MTQGGDDIESSISAIKGSVPAKGGAFEEKKPMQAAVAGAPQMPRGPPPKPKTKNAKIIASIEEEHYYSGPIKFYKLAATLHAIAKTMGHRSFNRNVLFAASSLKSAANLIPMACEMAQRNRNFAHLVLMGREALPLEDILEMNGVDTEKCKVFFHDARPDYSEYSTDVRAEVSVAGAMNHIHNFMHPQVVIMDDSMVEDVFFIKGMRGKMSELGVPIVEVPRGKYEDFLWMTGLDSVSLANWHKPNIDVLIHVPAKGAGGLIRLLKSLTAADYAGLTVPRLTIELPPVVDGYLKDFLQGFEWPPRNPMSGPRPQHGLRIHHRIPLNRASTEDSSIRFLESFYPSDPLDNHVLVLSSQAEVSPMYYQYLIYILLQYHWSGGGNVEREHLMGLALTSPQTHLDGKTPFKAPASKNQKDVQKDQLYTVGTPFMWQAPNADAVLVFGEKWAEVHSYVSNRLQVLHETNGATKQKKLVSETQPSWMEFFLEIMRARSWSVLYPQAGEAGQWATVHKELYQVPEEFKRPAKKADKKSDPEEPPAIEEPFLRGEDTPAPSNVQEKPIIQQSSSLYAILPNRGILPELPSIPLLDFEGKAMSWPEYEGQGAGYVNVLRETVGGCKAPDAGRPRMIKPGRTDDLFCLKGLEPEYIEDLLAPPPQPAVVVVGEKTTEPVREEAKALPDGAGVKVEGVKVEEPKIRAAADHGVDY